MEAITRRAVRRCPPTPLPGTIGSGVPANGPLPVARNWVSTKVMFAYATSITTCPGPATGSGASPATSTDGGPNSRSQTARTLDRDPVLRDRAVVVEAQQRDHVRTSSSERIAREAQPFLVGKTGW